MRKRKAETVQSAITLGRNDPTAGYAFHHNVSENELYLQ